MTAFDVLWLPGLALFLAGLVIGGWLGDVYGYSRGHFAGQQVMRRYFYGQEDTE